MAQRSVFISYRRDDAAGYPAVLLDRLAEHWPRDRIFADTHAIAPGADFVRQLEDAVGRCDVLVALIGPRWAGLGPDGRRRIEQPDDWVRAEIATALRRGVRVIPVLLDGTPMPAAEQLPEDIRALARINATELRGSRLEADMRDLTGLAITALGGKWPPDEPGGRLYAVLSVLYALLAGGMAGLMLLVSAFIDVPPLNVVAFLVIVAAAVVVLRLPLHHWLRTRTRRQALMSGAALHAAAMVLLLVGGESLDGAALFVFGIVPAGALLLGANAMRRARPA
jgi:hypothetical protein